MLLLCSSAVVADTVKSGSPASPDQIVRETATQMFAVINGHKTELKQHPDRLFDLIGNILLPHFDFDYSARLVLGRYWRSATPAQRKAFADAFYKFLVHSYASGMLKGNYSERNIEIEPWRGTDSDTRALIRSKVLRENAAPVEVDYAMVRTKEGWKAFDVTIEGISYVMNYRNQFGQEIAEHGLDALIKRLNADADKVSALQAASQGS
ncbi:MAG TPA: ABC transporter substrate-binding protein [Gammaproteobacteria bacterium]|nr:ABC transporter substrate-binding protein [Gammaproteobacteria bacterium]